MQYFYRKAYKHIYRTYDTQMTKSVRLKWKLRNRVAEFVVSVCSGHQLPWVCLLALLLTEVIPCALVLCPIQCEKNTSLCIGLLWVLICKTFKAATGTFDPWVGKIPWKKERLPTSVFWPGEFHGLCSQSMGSQRVRHDWATFTASVLCILCFF